jgi:hypothetical protein
MNGRWTDCPDREMDGSIFESIHGPFQIWHLGSGEEKRGEIWLKVAGQWLNLHCRKAEE